MSWQPVVAERSAIGVGPSPPGLPPSGKRLGVAMTFELVGVSVSTLTMETRSCGVWQSGYSSRGE